ncbi:MAG: hypothetical protein WCL47_02785 [Holophagaceae bacterium]
MGPVQGVSSSTLQSSYQVQRVAAAAVPKDKDYDGDVDKAGAVDKDKGNLINLLA